MPSPSFLPRLRLPRTAHLAHQNALCLCTARAFPTWPAMALLLLPPAFARRTRSQPPCTRRATTSPKCTGTSQVSISCSPTPTCESPGGRCSSRTVRVCAHVFPHAPPSRLPHSGVSSFARQPSRLPHAPHHHACRAHHHACRTRRVARRLTGGHDHHAYHTRRTITITLATFPHETTITLVVTLGRFVARETTITLAARAAPSRLPLSGAYHHACRTRRLARDHRRPPPTRNRQLLHVRATDDALAFCYAVHSVELRLRQV